LISELAGYRRPDPFEIMRKFKTCLIDFNLNGEVWPGSVFFSAIMLDGESNEK